MAAVSLDQPQCLLVQTDVESINIVVDSGASRHMVSYNVTFTSQAKAESIIWTAKQGVTMRSRGAGTTFVIIDE